MWQKVYIFTSAKYYLSESDCHWNFYDLYFSTYLEMSVTHKPWCTKSGITITLRECTYSSASKWSSTSGRMTCMHTRSAFWIKSFLKSWKYVYHIYKYVSKFVGNTHLLLQINMIKSYMQWSVNLFSITSTRYNH